MAEIVDVGKAVRLKKLDPTRLGGVAILRKSMENSIIGHEDNIDALVQAYTRFTAGLQPEARPAGMFLMLGPTGSGKTFTVTEFAKRALALTSPELVQFAPIRIDCGEYHSAHEVSKWLGAPPGYLGHRETKPVITNDRLKQQGPGINFILLDEVDKAHPQFYDMLLGVFDSGKLTLGDNSTLDFSRTMFLMTSNSGAKEMQERLQPTAGFARFASDHHRQETAEGAANAALTAMKKKIRPEFFNRLDKILIFQQLSKAQVAEVSKFELALLEAKLIRKGIGLTVSEAAREVLVNDGYDPRYGARHLKRSIQANLETPISNLIVSGQEEQGEVISVDGRALPLEFYKI